MLETIIDTKEGILNYGSWFIITSKMPEIEVNLKFNSDVNILLKNNDNEFDLFELYNLESSKRIVRNIAQWKKGRRLNMEEKNKMERRRDLMGKRFR